METTSESGGVIRFGEIELTNLIKMLTKGYRFTHGNTDPKVIIIPTIQEVNGIEIRYEGVIKVTEVKPKTKRG